MPLLKFGSYSPDLSDLNSGITSRLKNVTPRADGYGPFQALEAFTGSLPDRCRGHFFARHTDGSVTIFAGTATRLYRLNNTDLSWVDLSKDASDYSTLDTDANWRFAQFNNTVVACQRNVAVQSISLSSLTAFADVSGSPPNAGWVGVVGRFLVLADLASNPFRIHWSGLNDIGGWTAGTNLSDYQDLSDGGRVRCVAEVAGDVGLILQEGGARRMTFSQGSEAVFQIDKLPNVPGILLPGSLVVTLGGAYYVSPKGFVRVDAQGGFTPIGEETVSRTFLNTYDSSNPQLAFGAEDPRTNSLLWVYKSQEGEAALFDKGLIYHITLKRWSPIEATGESLAPVSRPGLTLESLDAIAPGALDIGGLADNGAGLVRVTVADTSGLTTGDYKTISGVSGSFGDAGDANGTWEIEVNDGTTFDLVGSSVANQNVTGTADNGSGAIRLTVVSTAAWTTGDKVVVADVGGTVEANGDFVVTVVDATHLDLDGTSFSNAWTSGGTVKDRYDSATDGGLVGGSLDDLPFSLDDVSTATLPNISAFTEDHELGFFAGENLEAELISAEQSMEGRRMNINGIRPITDAESAFGSVLYRDRLNADYEEGEESEMDADGFCPLLDEARFARARVRIAAGTNWSFATGVEPQVSKAGEF